MTKAKNWTLTHALSELEPIVYVAGKCGETVAAPLVGLVENKDELRPKWQMQADSKSARSSGTNEVFTPAWVCNRQLNLIDEARYQRQHLFNTPVKNLAGEQTWLPNPNFYSMLDVGQWEEFLSSPALEMCCGEGAYLTFRYDTATGEPIALARRAGVLDRKLHVCLSHALSTDGARYGFDEAGVNQVLDSMLAAAHSVYAYEFSARSVLLARANFALSLVEFAQPFLDCYSLLDGARKGQVLDELLSRGCELATKQIVQMDGLTNCLPLSCSTQCGACRKAAPVGHDGVRVVMFFDDGPSEFEHCFTGSTSR